MVVDEGAQVAGHLLTMAIRAIDYCPPTDITFADYLSALLTIDREVVPDDNKYNYRGALLDNFAKFDIKPAANADAEGIWRRFEKPLVYKRVRFDLLLRDKEEVFRFIWENRKAISIFTRMATSRSSRCGPASASVQTGSFCARPLPSMCRSSR